MDGASKAADPWKPFHEAIGNLGHWFAYSALDGVVGAMMGGLAAGLIAAWSVRQTIRHERDLATGQELRTAVTDLARMADRTGMKWAAAEEVLHESRNKLTRWLRERRMNDSLLEMAELLTLINSVRAKASGFDDVLVDELQRLQQGFLESGAPIIGSYVEEGDDFVEEDDEFRCGFTFSRRVGHCCFSWLSGRLHGETQGSDHAVHAGEDSVGLVRVYLTPAQLLDLEAKLRPGTSDRAL